MTVPWSPLLDLRLALSVLLVGVVAALAGALRRQNRMAPSRVLVLGAGGLASKLIDEIESAGTSTHHIVGLVDNRPPDEKLQAKAVWLGRLDRFAEIVERTRVDRIVVALPDRRGHLPLLPLLASRARGVVVEDALDFCERLTGKMAIEALTPGPLILSKGFRNHGVPEAIARAGSVVIAVAGLVMLSPLLALIGIAIKLDSKGPVLFVQARVGKDGRAFQLLKFRTMRPSQERPSEWVQDNADRITRVGRRLRRFRLDELPQLFNILRGEMNLVGPRPHPACNQDVFERHIAYYALRSTVRPGVTGWAQVCYGYANNIEEETEKMRYDLYYIKNRSLGLDARILLETLRIVLLGHGSNRARYRAPVSPGVVKPADSALSSIPVEFDALPR
jgi:exopolysaccharide biosynthesis polyprenyl glycosylphosphotransferase